MTFRPNLKPFFVILAILAAVVLLELLLAAFDPWGLRYFDDLAYLFTQFVADEARGYRLPDGDYRFHGWQAAMRGGTRLLPDTNAQADCTIVVLGDSVAFGYGVNDGETWVNLVAQTQPQVNLLNTGTVAYNSANVLGTLRAFPAADAYLYLVIDNDTNHTQTTESMHEQAAARPNLPWLLRYLWYVPRSDGAGDDPARFFRDLAHIAADERVTLLAFAGKPLTAAIRERGYDLAAIPADYARTSRADTHPNRDGNITLAQHLTPIVDAVVERYCG